MKLYYSVTSPFARKVLMCAMELSQAGEIEMKVVHPLKDAEELGTVSPLGKVPALVTDDGRVIVDSPVICQYLDSAAVASGHQSLNRRAGDNQADAVRHALADGIMDAAYLLVMETMRPEEQQSEYWKDRWASAIERTLDHLETEWPGPEDPSVPTMGNIALGCALGYLDFRLDHLSWRDGRASLTDWLAVFSERKSFAATVPQA